MKRFFSRASALLLILALLLTACAGAASSAPASSATPASSAPASSAAPAASSEAPKAEPVTVRVAGLKGPTTMGMVKLIEDAAAGKTANDYEFLLAGTADEVTPKLIQGELDLAAVPANLASVLYNKTEGKIRMVAVNTLGVLYVVDTTGEVASLADLKGRTVYATGKGATPEYTLRYLLKQNGIDPDADLTIEFKSEPTEILALLKQGGGVAMLPQPFVTAAAAQVEGLKVALDLTAEWDKLGLDSSIVTGVLIGRAAFLEENPEVMAAFLKEYEASTRYTNEHPAEAAALIEAAGIVAKAAIAEKAIPACNITFLAGEEMEKAVSGYLAVLFAENPASVGGKLPESDFYDHS